MAAWKLRVCKDGSQFIWVNTGLIDLNEAENFCRNLYGDDITIVGQEFINEDQSINRKRSWLWG